MSDKILVEAKGHILTIGLNRTDKANALDREMFRELGAAYTRLDEDPDLRCGVIHAIGRNFTSGLDLPDFIPSFLERANNPAADTGVVDPDDCNPLGLPIVGMPERVCRKPVIAAIQGRCYAAGIELVLAADMAVAGSDATFAQAEVRRGLLPLGAATIRFPQVFGWGNAMRWLLTGDPFDAREALRIGLVQELVEPGRHLERALEIADRIASAAPIAVQAALANARQTLDEGRLAAAHALEDCARPVVLSEDIQEGVRSLMEKREAQFQGR